MKIVQLIAASGKWVLNRQFDNGRNHQYQVACWALGDDNWIYPVIESEALTPPPEDWEYYLTRDDG